MRNPTRSEADAFWLLAIIAGGALAVVLVAVAFGGLAGAILAVVLLAVGGYRAWVAYRDRDLEPAEIAPHADFRLLVVANETVAGNALRHEVARRCAGKDAEILVMVPVVTTRLAHWTSDTDEARTDAELRLAEALRAFERDGLDARGEIGDDDPNQVIRDALGRFGADELIVATHPEGRSRWLEQRVVERAREETGGMPVTHVVVDLEAEAKSRARQEAG